MRDAIRLNKFLSAQGYCSRREADRLIEQGRVFVNNKRAQLGDHVSHADSVRVEGRDRKREEEKIYLLLNKPVGVATEAATEVAQLAQDIYAVGRLETSHSGLLLLTTDRLLAKRLMSRGGVEMEYVVTVDRPLQKIDIGRFQGKGLKVRQLNEKKFAVVDRGDTRQIETFCEHHHYRILHLMRTRIGPLKIPLSYGAGNHRRLTPKEVRDLKKLMGTG
ncbi:hypothetical protein HY631_00720 [Candidatus Uhrbacteria bacterium]|nr:hypothetical protein [Candidatus Uhrbacteria bacterium]